LILTVRYSLAHMLSLTWQVSQGWTALAFLESPRHFDALARELQRNLIGDLVLFLIEFQRARTTAQEPDRRISRFSEQQGRVCRQLRHG
jgi:hypothetical protein